MVKPKKPTIRGIKRKITKFTTKILHFGRRTPNSKEQQHSRSISNNNDVLHHEHEVEEEVPEQITSSLQQPPSSPPIPSSISLSISPEPHPVPGPSSPPPHHQSSSKRLTARVLGLHNKIWHRKRYYRQKQLQREQEQQLKEQQQQEEEQEQQAVCGCGRPLEAGWECPYCRFTCPTCHRALGEGEQCSRCQPSDPPLPISTIAS